MAEARSMNEQTGADNEAQITIKSEPALERMLLRDVAVMLAAISIWAAADTWYTVTGLAIAQVIAVADAALAGVIVAVLLHEWGHYAGARISGASVRRVMPPGLSPSASNSTLRKTMYASFTG